MTAELGAAEAVETIKRKTIVDSAYQCTIGRSFHLPTSHWLASLPLLFISPFYESVSGILLNFLACLPLINSDIPAVLSLDQRCLGGLWTKSGYQRELESDCSDLLVIVSATDPHLLARRQALKALPTEQQTVAQQTALAAKDPADSIGSDLLLLGVGCLWAILEEAHITTLAVEPSYQGHKLGQLLLTELLLCAHRRGLTRATLEVRQSNHRALKLYQKFDFKTAGMRKRYYSDGENACILWRGGLKSEAALQQITQQQRAAIAQLTTANHLPYPSLF